MLFNKLNVLFLLFFGTLSAQYISVDDSFTPTQLVEDVLINSTCATVSNVAVSGGNFTSGEKSYGFFSANGSNFPFDEGIILSTGKINNAIGPNNSILDDTAPGWLGDTDLEQALNLNGSFDSTILEFDFIPLSNQISFDYIFSSEQYLSNPNANQCNYTDGFAFLIKVVGSTLYENLAVVPNTNIPVKVNTVRGAGTICPPANSAYFDAFNNQEHPTNFNGQTVALTARATVIPGNQYHIKLVIADEGNYRYDSAIFLKGSSFNLGIDLGDHRTFANQNPICFDESITLNGTIGGAQSYQWSLNNTPIPGATNGALILNPPYTSTQNGTYTVATTFSPTCIIKSKIDLDFSPQLILGQTSYTFCDDQDNTPDGIHTTILSDIVPTLFPSLPATTQVEFYVSPTNTTALPNSFQNTTPFQQTIYARIPNNNCFSNIPVILNFLVFSPTVQDETNFICNNNQITLTANPGFQSYLWDTGETTPTIQITTAQNHTVTITNTDGCTKIKTFTIDGSEIATIENITINDFSDTNSIVIIATGNGDYDYSINGIHYQDSPVFSNLNTIEQTAYVRDKNGCGIATKDFYLIQIPKYFTPNGDGFNETWNIKNLTKRGYNQTIISIFNRYGKLLKQFSATGNGWDGTYNGTQLPADDYWFTLTNAGKQLVRGHFTLKR